MPMDDATASTTAEVTIEVSSETTAGDAAGNYVIVRTFTATDDAGNSSSARRPSLWRTPQRLSSPSSCRLHRRVLGRDADGRRHGVDNCGEVTIEVSAKPRAAMPPATT